MSNIEWNKINPCMKFHDLNQSDEEITKKMCRYYAPAINLKYNCGIELKENDLIIIAKNDPYNQGKDEWWKVGGYGADGVEQVYNYVKENAETRGWEVPNLIRFGLMDTFQLNKWLERGYAAMIGIKVNKEFYRDVKTDKNLDKFEDYVNYQGGLGHFTNIAKWIKNEPHDMMIDSYFDKKGSTYRVDINKVLNKISLKSKYIFF